MGTLEIREVKWIALKIAQLVTKIKVWTQAHTSTKLLKML